MSNGTMDNKDFVSVKPSNGEYNTLQVDLKALPFRSKSGEYSRVWLDGNEIKNVTALTINASTGAVTEVTISFHANVYALLGSGLSEVVTGG